MTPSYSFIKQKRSLSARRKKTPGSKYSLASPLASSQSKRRKVFSTKVFLLLAAPPEAIPLTITLIRNPHQLPESPLSKNHRSLSRLNWSQVLQRKWAKIQMRSTTQKWPHSSRWWGKRNWLQTNLSTWFGSIQMTTTTWRSSPIHRSLKIRWRIIIPSAARESVNLWARSQ